MSQHFLCFTPMSRYAVANSRFALFLGNSVAVFGGEQCLNLYFTSTVRCPMPHPTWIPSNQSHPFLHLTFLIRCSATCLQDHNGSNCGTGWAWKAQHPCCSSAGLYHYHYQHFTISDALSRLAFRDFHPIHPSNPIHLLVWAFKTILWFSGTDQERSRQTKAD